MPVDLCPNCQSDKHRRCCARCGVVHRAARRDLEFCSAKCELVQRYEDAASAESERPLHPYGAVADSEIAALDGVTRSAIGQRRKRRGIEAAGATPGPKPVHGETSQTYTIRLTPGDVDRFTRAAGGKSWRVWLAALGRSAT